MRTLLLVLLLAACSGELNERGDDGESEPVTVVELAPVERGGVSEVLRSTATVESESSADIVPSASGVVLSIHREEGDRVQRGDLLAVIDNVSLDAGAARARDELRQLERQHAELQRLRSEGAVSERELSDLEHQLRLARTSNVEASRSLGHARLTAPFDGVVARRDIKQGELATSSQVAFQIVDPSRLRVVTALPERDLGLVHEGQTVELVSAYDADVGATGIVVRKAPVVDAASGTFRVTIAVDAGQTLLPGQFVSVAIEVERREDVVVVPKRAVVHEDGIAVVYRRGAAPTDDEEDEAEDDAEEAGGFNAELLAGMAAEEAESDGNEEEDEGPSEVAERMVVELGLVDDVWAQILDGVDEGDDIVVVGQSHLRDGARIREAEGAGEG